MSDQLPINQKSNHKMESKYSSFSRDIIHGYEKVLASIFIKLYVDLYKWLSKSFSIHEDYIDLDKDQRKKMVELLIALEQLDDVQNIFTNANFKNLNQ